MVSINVSNGDPVAVGQKIAVIEAMKMELEIKSDKSGYVSDVCVGLHDVLSEGDPILFLKEAQVSDTLAAVAV